MNLIAVPSSSESINVMWDIPQYPNGPLFEYRIYYNRSNVSSGSNYTTVEFPTHTINITGLEVFTNYSIFVVAIGIKIGDMGEEIQQRTNASRVMFESPTSTVQIAAPTANSFVFDLPPPTITTGPLK